MVQEFHVLRCFSCESFQVQQVKKVNRWSCKMCGEKQSLLKEFGRGSGADCRRHVQKLNAMRGSMTEEREHSTLSLWKQVEEDEENEPEGQEDDQATHTQVTHAQASRWNKYLDTPEEAGPEEEEEEEEEENLLMDRQHLHGNNMINRKRKRGGWTDRGAQNSLTPGQSNWSSVRTKPAGPSTRTTSLDHTSPPSLNSTRTTSLNHTSLNHTSPPSLNRTSLNHTSPPSLNSTRTTSLNYTSLNHTSPPSLNSTRTTSLNHTSPHSLNSTGLNRTSLNHTSPPNNKSINPPSVSTGPVSRWAGFLSSHSQVEEEEEEEPPVGGWSQSVGGAASLTCNDLIVQTRPRPLRPVSSMFESGEEFSFDESELLIKL